VAVQYMLYEIGLLLLVNTTPLAGVLLLTQAEKAAASASQKEDLSLKY